MKTRILSLATLLTLSLGFVAAVSAQQTERSNAANSLYVVSAKAGGVNLVEGKVAVTDERGKSGYLVKGDSLEIGEKVSTGANSKAEILLNPGSYVRLDENSEFEFVTTALEDLEVKISRGSAMFEVFAADEFKVAIDAAGEKFYLVETGVYRVDVLADGASKIAVWKGRAELADGTEIKKSREAVVKNGQIAVEKFDRDEKDDLEIWSKDRAKLLAKVNSKLERDNVRNHLINSYNRSPWSVYDSFGLWYYSPMFSSYCFLPFGWGWSSPYGYGYGWDIWGLRLPRYIRHSIMMPVNTAGGVTTTTTNGNPGNSNTRRPTTRNQGFENTGSTPPFETVRPNTRRTIEPNSFPSPATSFPSSATPFPTRTVNPTMTNPQGGDKRSRP